MKKVLMILGLVALVGFVGAQAGAQGPYGGGGYHMGPGSCWMTDTPEGRRFAEETAPLRQSLYEKQRQRYELVNQPDADPAEIGVLTKEIHELRQQLWQMAEDAGFRGGYGRGMRGRHYGMGPGCPWWGGGQGAPQQTQ
jgi:hypothetical protein